MTAARSCVLYDTIDYSTKTFNSVGELGDYLGMRPCDVIDRITNKRLVRKRYNLFYGNLKEATDVMINIYKNGVFVKQVHGIRSAVYFIMYRLSIDELLGKRYRSIYQNIYACLHSIRGQKRAYGYEFRYGLEELQKEAVNNA